MANKRLILVDNWKEAHTWASMWWSALGFIVSFLDLVSEIWDSLDHHTIEHIPYAGAIGIVIFTGTMAGRVLIWTHDHLEPDDADDQVNQ